MAYIETVSESDAEGRLAELYRRFANSDGSVDNVLKVHSLNPAALLAHAQLYMQAIGVARRRASEGSRAGRPRRDRVSRGSRRWKLPTPVFPWIS